MYLPLIVTINPRAHTGLSLVINTHLWRLNNPTQTP